MFFFLPAFGYAQVNLKINDAKKYYHLHGQVKTVTTMTCESPGEKAGKVTVGNCDWGNKILFNKEGQELEYQGLEKEQQVVMVAKSLYNAQGLYRGFESYDANGVLTERSEVRLSSENLVEYARIYDVHSEMKLRAIIESAYDNRGNPISNTHFDAEKKQLFKTTSNYNAKNQKTNERDYDDLGNIIEVRTFTYNDAGDLIQKKTLNNRRNKIRTLSYQYKLDDYGNWIQKREYKKGKLRTVWQRQITYF